MMEPMEAHSSEWYSRIAKEVSLYKDTLNKKDYKKYRLDLLQRVAKRVDGFADICEECRTFKQDITALLQDINYVFSMAMTKEKRKDYSRRLNGIIKHLQKHHKLVTEGQYMAMWSGIGSAIGVALGAALGNMGAGVGLGAGIGVAVGVYMDKKAKKEGRVI